MTPRAHGTPAPRTSRSHRAADPNAPRKTRSQWEDRASGTFVRAGLMGVLAFAPLAFGAVHAWAYGMVWGAVWILLTLWGVGAFARALRGRGGWEIQWFGAAFQPAMALFAIWVLLQCVPLPAAWVGWLQPETLRVHDLAVSLTGDSPRWVPFTVYPKASSVGIFHLWSYAGVFYLTLYHLRTRRHLLAMAILWTVLGAFEALYGLGESLAGTHRIWWWTNPYGEGSVNGTFINRNHLAGYLEMTLLVTVGVLLAIRAGSREGRRLGWRGRLSRIAGDDQWAKGVLVFFLAVLMGTALLLSLSRGGSLALTAVLLPISGVLLWHGPTRRYGVMGMAVFVGMVLYAAPLGLDALVDRLGEVELGLADRQALWASTWRMASAFPSMGTGWATFEWVYPRFKPEQYGEFIVDHAHNDWLELMGETGFVGGALVVGGVVLYLWAGFRVWRTRRDPWAVWLGFGALASVVVLAAHGIGEFLLHTHANALTLAAVMAWGWAALHHHRRGGDPGRFAWRTRRHLVPRWIGIGVFVILAAGHLLVGLGMARHLLAEGEVPTEQNSTVARGEAQDLAALTRAVTLDPGNATRWAWLSREVLRQGLPPEMKAWAEGQRVRGEGDGAVPYARAFLLEAIRRNPTNPDHWEQMGWLLAGQPKSKEAGLAERALRTAIFLDPGNGRRHFHMGHYLLVEGRTGQAMQALALAVALSPGLRSQVERTWQVLGPRKGALR